MQPTFLVELVDVKNDLQGLAKLFHQLRQLIVWNARLLQMLHLPVDKLLEVHHIFGRQLLPIQNQAVRGGQRMYAQRVPQDLRALFQLGPSNETIIVPIKHVEHGPQQAVNVESFDPAILSNSPVCPPVSQPRYELSEVNNSITVRVNR